MIVLIVDARQWTAPVSVGQLVITHINNEPQKLTRQLSVGQSQLDSVLAEIGMTTSASIDDVTYASGCTIRNNKKGAHLVLRGKKGPITVLIMPDEPVAARVQLEGGHYHGLIFPAGYGSIAVIGERGELIEEVERNINFSVAYLS